MLAAREAWPGPSVPVPVCSACPFWLGGTMGDLGMVRRHCLMALVSGAAVIVAGLVATAPAQARTATAPAAGAAPGAPGAPSYFDLARKDCVGTAAGRGSKRR
jgi:hypothetical protein